MMATITLPVRTLSGYVDQHFEIDELSFARSITRQGKGARAAWRHHLSQLRFPVIESDAVREWNGRRYKSTLHVGSDVQPLHGIRADHRLNARIKASLQGDPWAMIDGPRLKPGDPDDIVPPRTDDAPLPGADDDRYSYTDE